MTFGRWLMAIALIATPGLAQAQEGSGCGGFRWPLDHERAALTRADKPSLPNGGALAYEIATTLKLEPLASAGLPKAPERASKYPSDFAGHFTLGPPVKPGIYKITIDPGGWIDVLDGAPISIPLRIQDRRAAKACARASSSTCRPDRSRFSSAASGAIKSPLSFRPTDSPCLSSRQPLAKPISAENSHLPGAWRRPPPPFGRSTRFTPISWEERGQQPRVLGPVFI